MKPFDSLTHAGRFRRLRRVAVGALTEFGLEGARLRPLVCWENATWRADSPRGSFLVRVHRHGYRSASQLEAELDFLEALRRGGLAVAAPRSTRTGDRLARIHAPGVPGPRLCTVLSWVDGRIHPVPGSGQLRRVGMLFARLHTAAAVVPAFPGRPRYDDTGWFRPALPTGVPALEARLTDADRTAIERTEPHIATLFARLDRGPTAWGPIHADLHFHNVVHTPNAALPIDFDDMGTGPHLYDLAIAYMRCSRRPDAAAAWGHVVDGYRSLRPLSDAALDDVRALAVLQMPGVVRYIASRWPDPEVVSLLERVCADTRRVVARWEAGDPWPFVTDPT